MQSNQQMKSFVIQLLKDNLSKLLYYHNVDHTTYVADKVLEIGKNENCSELELNLVHTAALWHDTGYITTYNNHEKQSCLLASKYLPDYGYSKEDILQICDIIMATKIPQLAKTKLEQILADADLEYLGTDLFEGMSESLYKEIKEVNPSLNKEKWDEVQIAFLENHSYFTKYCKENNEPIKQRHLKKLIDLKKLK